MNWYKIFYWITVADGVKKFFDIASNLFITASVIGTICWLIGIIGYTVTISSRELQDAEAEASDPDIRSFLTLRRIVTSFLRTSVILMILTWAAYAAIPSKKDALMIVAGGAVGNFITSDSSAKQIPAEAMLLLRSKMKEEIQNINAPVKEMQDTLASKSKEELIELIKQKKSQ